AFWSLAVQIVGLVGENGIEPIGHRLEQLTERLGDQRYWRFPTLCWYDASDRFLQLLCWAGMGLSTLLIVGIMPTVTLALLWILYLSLTTAGGTFLNFQWDILLLEVGLLSVFFAPLRFFDRPSKSPPVSKIVLVLLWWLLFRLMFLSGVVKWQADPIWRDLTALTVHFETQPLPIWTAWYWHRLPLWWHKFSCAVMFGIEVGLPFLIFGPRRLRQIAAFGIILLMVLIGATGNYNFFNLLTIALCIPLLDDAFWRKFFPKRRLQWLDTPGRPRWTIWLRRPIHLAFAVFVIILSTGHGLRRLGWHPELVEKTMPLIRRTYPFHPANSYGLFANMTDTRPEIIIEGSNDTTDWKPYEFYWKPGDVNVAPKWVQPHQPRVDWQMWFAALGNYRRNPWFVSLARRLLEGEPTVLAFFKTNPFSDEPPRYIRAVLYDYRFSDPEAKAQTGAWWTRKRLRLYLPPVTLRTGRLQFAR
ncbi:MAG TPA: lipase maturation factor family protein, partial [Alphaproteobacteria bacterium]|nr:lipase maturation factor family protein [Alphaproteobacteria bacterium]